MKEIKTLLSDDFNDLIPEFEQFGMNLGLERIKNALKDMGEPSQDIPSIQIVGTNGKGSVCAIIAQILTTSGYKTGLFIFKSISNRRVI